MNNIFYIVNKKISKVYTKYTYIQNVFHTIKLFGIANGCIKYIYYI